MKKPSCIWTILALAVLLPFVITACDSDSSGGDDEEIPDGILYLARDVFGTLSLVFKAGSDPASGDYPEGMTVTSGATEGSYTIALASFSPEDSEAVVNGSAALEITDTDPYHVSITGSITLTGADYSTASLSATASWDEGESPSLDNPSSFSGTFVVDGSSYPVKDIMAAIEELDGDEPAPPPVAPEPPPADQATSSR